MEAGEGNDKAIRVGAMQALLDLAMTRPTERLTLTPTERALAVALKDGVDVVSAGVRFGASAPRLAFMCVRILHATQ